MKIILEAHNPRWTTEFSNIQDQLNTCLSNIKIHHIGSTAIPGIVAKPIIDILIGASQETELDDYIQPLIKQGYAYIKEYEKQMPYRRYFEKYDSKGNHTQHIHLVHSGHEFYSNHLFFRDYMIKNREYAREYEKLKIKLSQQVWQDGNEYAEAKSDFILAILKKGINTKNWKK